MINKDGGGGHGAHGESLPQSPPHYGKPWGSFLISLPQAKVIEAKHLEEGSGMFEGYIGEWLQMNLIPLLLLT